MMGTLIPTEMLKLVRQPAILFWGFLVVPLVAVLLKLVIEGFLLFRMGHRSAGDVDLFLSAARGLSLSRNSLGHLLFALGVASVFFLEYRYSTWRLLVPRHARFELYAAKLIVCLAWLALGLLVVVLGDIALNLLFSLIKGQGGGALLVTSGSFSLLLIAAGIAFLELAVLASLVAVIVVIFRSMIAAVLSAFLLAIGSTLLQLYLGADADRLPLPSYAAQALRDWLLAGGSEVPAMLGFAVLLGWLVVLNGLGLAVFSRQQLAVE
ncbi:MAG: ABC transporter permease [Alphaproteobacteria bacterium]|nr:ABC transporter permease [Alphaproteobacteria bacterium]